MFIPVHLLFIGHIAFFGEQCLTRPSKEHRRRQADQPTYTELTRNVIPIVPSEYDIPGIQLIQNKELLYPTNIDSQGNLIYLPPAPNEVKHEEEVLPNMGISEMLGREMKALQRDQRKQPKPDETDTCGHFHKNDYNMLTNIIGKMSPEARNALIDALLKTLMEKSKVSAAKSCENKLVHPLDAALQPPVRVNKKPEGPLVQPFSLTVEREKLRDLYKYLNNEKFRNGLKKTNVMINLGELLQETMRKDSNITKKPHCCHKHPSAKPVEAEVTSTESSAQMREEVDSTEEICNYGDQYGDGPPGLLDFPGDRVINLTQVFNVHPKLLIVNAGQMVPTDIAGLLNEAAKESPATTTATDTATTTTCTTPSTVSTPPSPPPTPPQPTTTTTTTATTTTAGTTFSNPANSPTPPTLPVATAQQAPSPMVQANIPPTRSPNHRKCTRRQLCRHGYRYRYDRRGRINPVHDLVYTYYMDMDDLPIMDD